MKRLFLILLACMNLTGAAARGKEVPRIVNFINFVRDIEPRIEAITPQVLYETTKAEAEAIHKWGFKGTWLLQYDALIDSRYQALMREELAHGGRKAVPRRVYRPRDRRRRGGELQQRAELAAEGAERRPEPGPRQIQLFLGVGAGSVPRWAQ